MRYFGGLEEAKEFKASAGFLGFEVTATTPADPDFRVLLPKILLEEVGLSYEVVAAGMEEFTAGSGELERAA